MQFTTPHDDTTVQFPNTAETMRVFAISVACLVVALFFISLRGWALKAKGLIPALEDYFAFSGFVGGGVSSGLTIREVLQGGIGRHATVVWPSRLVRMAKMLIGIQVAFGFSLGCLKISMCLFYIRIFETQKFRNLARWVLGLCVLWTLAATLVPLLICEPITANWRPEMAADCGNRTAGFIIIAAGDIVTDLIILALPMRTVIKLQVPRSIRIGLIVVFSLGVFTMIISVQRVIHLAKVDYDDFSFTAYPAFIWSAIEPVIGLGIACSPHFRSLYGTQCGAAARAKRIAARNGPPQHQESGHGGRRPFNTARFNDIELADLDPTVARCSNRAYAEAVRGGTNEAETAAEAIRTSIYMRSEVVTESQAS